MIMIEALSRKVVNYLIGASVITDTDDDRELYQYGVEITISSMLNIFLIVIIGFVTNSISESLLFLVCFIIMRSYTGGYHANSYFICNLLFCIAFITELIIYKFSHNCISVGAAILMCTPCVLILLIICPIESQNKPIIGKRKKLKAIAVTLSLVFSIIGLILISLDYRYGVLIIYTVVLVTILAIVGYFKERRRNHVKE